MTRKTLAMLAIVGLLLVSMFGSVAAQTGPEPDPVDDPTTASPFLTHPVVKLLGAYFGRDTGDAADPDPLEPVTDPLADPTETPVTPESVAAEIAAYHEEGLGFGVLVKLYAMAEESRAACEAAPVSEVPGEECTPLLVDDLVTEFKSGAGMGTLYKEYGKPALRGVGHVRKALKASEQEQVQTDDENTTEQGKKNNKPPKLPKDKRNK